MASIKNFSEYFGIVKFYFENRSIVNKNFKISAIHEKNDLKTRLLMTVFFKLKVLFQKIMIFFPKFLATLLDYGVQTVLPET